MQKRMKVHPAVTAARRTLFFVTLTVFAMAVQSLYSQLWVPEFEDLRWIFINATFLISCVFSGIFIFHAWEAMVPAKAIPSDIVALLLVIPFFNLYWIFIVLPTLSRCTESKEISVKRRNLGLTVLAILACGLFDAMFASVCLEYELARLNFSSPTLIQNLEDLTGAAAFAVYAVWAHWQATAVESGRDTSRFQPGFAPKDRYLYPLRAGIGSAVFLFVCLTLPHFRGHQVRPYTNPWISNPQRQWAYEQEQRTRENKRNQVRSNRGELPVWQGSPANQQDAGYRMDVENEAERNQNTREFLESIRRT